MSSFNYEAYQAVKARAAAQESTGSNFARVGFFKLKDDNDMAVVRMNVSSMADLEFASVHQLRSGNRFMKVNCLNEVGSYSDACPFCVACATDSAIGKAAKRVYVQMLTSYRDASTGTYSEPVPTVWERPAGFATEIATKLSMYGNLKEVLLVITRHGAAGDMKTTYSIDYAVPTVFKPELIPADFSAFNTFDNSKHSFWNKTADEMNTYLQTGDFPERNSQQAAAAAPISSTNELMNAFGSTPVSSAQTAFQPESTVRQPAVDAPFEQPYNTVPYNTAASQAPTMAMPTADSAPATRTAMNATSQPAAERPVRSFGAKYSY